MGVATAGTVYGGLMLQWVMPFGVVILKRWGFSCFRVLRNDPQAFEDGRICWASRPYWSWLVICC